MSEAFVETTVLTDFILKRDGSEVRARRAFKQYSKVTVPQFAWKEYKRGPLRAFVWLHNKLALSGSLEQALVLLQRLSRTPQRYLNSTAIQGLHTAFVDSFKGVSLKDLKAKYGELAELDKVHADALKFELRRRILKWNKRDKLFGAVTHRLACYPDAEITTENNLLDLSPRDCPLRSICSLQNGLTRKALLSARTGIPPSSTRSEQRKRRRLLRRLAIHPSTRMDTADCRTFGDAYFVLFCPKGATILSTNLQDIEPMARPLGINVMRP
jgi:hypothetical protein